MITVNGIYNSAKVFTSSPLDEASLEQIIITLEQPFVEGSMIRMMPDVHAGAGCTIGTTMTIKDKVCPNLVGVDIGCGMLAARIAEDDIDFDELDKTIRENIPSGLNVRESLHAYSHNIDLSRLYCANGCNLDRAYHSVGTLGGGNHFIEVDVDQNKYIWLVIHTGSRHLGLEVANYYQRLAVRYIRSLSNKDEAREIIDRLKREGRPQDIRLELIKLKNIYESVPKALCWLEGEDTKNYLHDMEITQRFADNNRMAILETICGFMKLHVSEMFSTIHNYIDTRSMILRKGAISAKKGERVIIPMNMRDGSLICVGKGNPDWNFSAPHGAGRIMSRSEARKSISLDDFKESMNGIWTTSVNTDTLDESPMAYKPIESIINNIGDTVEIIDTIKPIYNFKASE